MNVIITGVRDFWNEGLIAEAVKRSGYKITKVISGLGKGVEYGALRWANANNIRTVGFDLYPYIKSKDPNTARLIDMIEHSQAVIYITDGKEKNGRRIIQLAAKRGLPIFHMIFKKEHWHGV